MEHGSPGVPTNDLVTVRKARRSDIEAALTLFEEVVAEGRWLATEAPIDRDERRQAWLEHMEAGLGATFIATAGDALVGELSLHRGEGGVVVLGMLVARAWRRKGIGARLVEAAVAWAEARPEIVRIDLAVFTHNRPAIMLYLKHGFIENDYRVDAFPRSNGEKWDAIIMRREFKRTP